MWAPRTSRTLRDPSVGAPSNRKPEGDRHGRADLGVIGKKPAIRSIPSGSRGAVQPEAGRGPAWTDRPRRRQDDGSSRNRNPKTTGTVGTSDLSGSRDPSEPPVGPLGPSGFPGTQVTSRTTKRSSKPPRTTGGQSPTTTEPPNHKTINTPDPPRPRRDHIDHQGHSTRSWAPRPSRIPGTRVVSPTPSDPHQHAHNHDQPGRKSPHLGPPFPEPER
nr:collectin-12-like [Aedes albopictus]